MLEILYDHGLDSNHKPEEGIPAHNNLFKGEDLINGDEVDGFKGDSKSDSQEDIEAVIQDHHIMGSNNSSTHNLNKSKINGYVKDQDNYSNGNRGEVEDLHKHSTSPPPQKDDNSKEGEMEFDERGGSGQVNDAGNIDSPNNQTKNNFIRKDSDVKDSDTKVKVNGKVDTDRNNQGWDEESKNKIQSEDEKIDEERSLLDPICINEDEVYAKELSSPHEDKDIRRSSTKPEQKNASESKEKSKISGTGLEESSEYGPTKCQNCKEK